MIVFSGYSSMIFRSYKLCMDHDCDPQNSQTPRITLNYTNTTNNKRNKKISKEVFLFNFLALDFSHDQNEKRSESVTLFLDNFFFRKLFFVASNDSHKRALMTQSVSTKK